MRVNDQQQGRPSILYCATYTNILTVPYPVEGMQAWDLTNHRKYAYNGTAWVLTTADWNTLENKPATFPSSAHTHSEYVDGTIERNPHYVLAGPASGIIATAPDWRALVTSDFMPQQGVITGDPTGFTSPADVIVTYDPTTQKVTLTGTVVAYWQGAIIPVLVSGWVSAAHPNVTGHRYYLSYNGSSFVWGDNTSWDFKQLQIAYVNYGTTDKYAIRECHGLMPWQAHEGFHDTVGAYRESGGTLSWAGAIPSDTTAANRRPDVAQTVMHDEDLITTNAALTSKLYTKCFLTSTSTLNYTVETAEIISVTGAIPNYNLYTGGTWTQAAMGLNTYTCVWLVAVPVTASVGSQKYRYLWFQGQSAGALAAQQALTPSDVNLGTLAADATEFVFLAKVIVNYQAAGGGNWIINSVTTLSGNHFQQVGSATAGFLTEVTTDASLSGVGTVASPLTIPNAAITLAKMANLTSQRVIGRITAGAGVPEELTGANIRTILGTLTADAVPWTGITSVPGYVFVPIAPQTMYDTGGGAWNGSIASKATGTYSFNLQDANNGLPATIQAVALFLNGTWVAASNTSSAGVRPRGGSTSAFVIRAMVAGIASDAQGICAVDATNHDIDVVIAGAALTYCVLRCVGYWL